MECRKHARSGSDPPWPASVHHCSNAPVGSRRPSQSGQRVLSRQASRAAPRPRPLWRSLLATWDSMQNLTPRPAGRAGFFHHSQPHRKCEAPCLAPQRGAIHPDSSAHARSSPARASIPANRSGFFRHTRKSQAHQQTRQSFHFPCRAQGVPPAALRPHPSQAQGRWRESQAIASPQGSISGRGGDPPQ